MSTNCKNTSLNSSSADVCDAAVYCVLCDAVPALRVVKATAAASAHPPKASTYYQMNSVAEAQC